jgi:hypothetical protein
MTYGIDSSAGGFVSPETLIAAGRPLAFGYAVNDLSPRGRGMTTEAYTNYISNGVDVGLYWEGSAAWMLGGYNAGGAAAENYIANRSRITAPSQMPGIFAHDIDPEPQHFQAINACLNGAKDVLGSWDQVGVYGGWLLIEYLAGGGNITYLVQTSAWEYGRGVHPAACMYQYGYNAYYDGVNCDLIMTLKPEYGGAMQFLNQPETVPGPVYPAIVYPNWYVRSQAQAVPSRAVDANGNVWFPQRFRAAAMDEAVPHIEPSSKAPAAGPHIPKGTKIDVHWAFDNDAGDGKQWWATAGGYYLASSFTPVIELPHARKPKKAA